MKKFGIWTTIVALVVGGLVATLWPVSNWRMWDANWQPLAMTHAENFCAGRLLVEGVDSYNQVKVKQCYAEFPDLDNTEPSIANSVRWACEGIFTLEPWPVEECMATVESYNVWFLQWGGFTTLWNAAHPRPSVIDEGVIINQPRSVRDGETGVRND